MTTEPENIPNSQSCKILPIWDNIPLRPAKSFRHNLTTFHQETEGCIPKKTKSDIWNHLSVLTNTGPFKIHDDEPLNETPQTSVQCNCTVYRAQCHCEGYGHISSGPYKAHSISHIQPFPYTSSLHTSFFPCSFGKTRLEILAQENVLTTPPLFTGGQFAKKGVL